MIEPGAAGDEKRPIRAQETEAMQALYTEHWSLLATRSLTYSEIFSRVSIFLALLSGAVIALALVAQAAHFGPTFISIAILTLSLVLFVGVTTVGRLIALNSENIRWVIGMNRLRRAYLDRNPELEPYFISGSRDDMRGVMLTMGFDRPPRPGLRSVFGGLQTMPGVVSVIVGAVAGALLGLIAVAFGAPELAVELAAAGTFGLWFLLFSIWARRAFFRQMARLEVRFPSSNEP